jgi:hypothetical protein
MSRNAGVGAFTQGAEFRNGSPVLTHASASSKRPLVSLIATHYAPRRSISRPPRS